MVGCGGLGLGYLGLEIGSAALLFKEDYLFAYLVLQLALLYALFLASFFTDFGSFAFLFLNFSHIFTLTLLIYILTVLTSKFNLNILFPSINQNQTKLILLHHNLLSLLLIMRVHFIILILATPGV